MKVLVVTMPCFGDNVPFAGFVEELGKRGHKVDVISSSANIPGIKELFEKENVNFIDFDIERLEGYKPGRKITIEDDAEIFALQIEEAFNRAGDYDVVIYDYFAFPMYYLNGRKDIKLIRYFPNFAFDENISKRIFESDEKNLAQTAHAIELGDDIISRLTEKGYNFKYSDMGKEVLNNVPELTIVHTLRQMQPFEENFDERFEFVGANTTPPSTNDSDIPFGEMKGKIIYVSFGTIQTEIGDRRLGAFKAAIEAFKGEDVSVIMSIGAHNKKEDFDEIPDNFYVYDYVPQTEVLKRADLFITHCGMNSVNDSIYSGVPMIGIPGAYDQMLTAETLENRKIGREIRIENLTPEVLKETAFAILDGEEEYSNVRTLGDIMKGLNCDQKTADIIERYAMA
ncbi:MAG: hypothetical protein IK018_04900 [Lachnospiraceae bacterium]|nr:hypothetical protein [Lachnospiraceae bacterium]